MLDYIEELELMRGRIGYDYAAEMARDLVKWMERNIPCAVNFLKMKHGNKGAIYEDILNHFQNSDDWRRLGINSRFALRPWQYKDMVKRAGSRALEQACENNGISRETVLNAIFADDWQRLDELIRYDQLSKAAGLAIETIWSGKEKRQ